MLDNNNQSIKKVISLPILNTLYTELNNRAKAIEADIEFSESQTIKERLAKSYNNIGEEFFTLDDHKNAICCYKKALELCPGSIDVYRNFIYCMERMNRLDEAQKLLEILNKIDDKSYETRLLNLILEYRLENYENAKLIFDDIIKDFNPSDLGARAFTFHGKVLEKLGNHDDAFQAFSRANELNLATQETVLLNDGSQRLLEDIAIMRSLFTKKIINSWNVTNNKTDFPSPVFLVGFPRSGTTLIEQILNTHTSIVTIDERDTLKNIREDFLKSESKLDLLGSIDHDKIICYQTDYWKRVKNYTEICGKKVVVIDKLPLRIRFLGLIYRFFPEAKIIVAIRDPRDVVLSNFKQNYRLNPEMFHFLTLEGTARFYEEVMGLYLHYKKTLPLNILEIRYEDLVESSGLEIRKLLEEFLEQKWEKGVVNYYKKAGERKINTPSYDQVVKPIYKDSVFNWKNYKKHLTPVSSFLERYINAFGYILDNEETVY